MHYEDHDIERGDAWKYQSHSMSAGKSDQARIYYDDNGNIDEKKTYSSQYMKQLHQEEDNDDDIEESSSKRRHSSSRETSSDEEGSSFCEKFLCTIILVLPIWWCIKAIGALCVAGVKAIGYIITWPFRILLCCCCETDVVPSGIVDWPKYDF